MQIAFPCARNGGRGEITVRALPAHAGRAGRAGRAGGAGRLPAPWLACGRPGGRDSGRRGRSARCRAGGVLYRRAPTSARRPPNPGGGRSHHFGG